jgi:uncharacterized protein YjbI with pentapeptide repeats
VSGPFKFLAYYEEADAASFGGRERESGEIADRVARTRTHILYGRSGLGKTSLILAGVFPELRRRGWTPVHIRTLADPIGDLLLTCEALAAELKVEVPAAVHGDASARVLAILRGLPERDSVVLVFDQFEEFFIRFRDNPKVREAFIELIAAIAGDRRVAGHKVFSLREDYLAEMDEFRSRLPKLFDHEYRLRAMTAYGVRQAIARPLDVAGVAYEPRLLTGLVDRLSDLRFDSVMLQILCDEVYHRAEARAQAAGRTKLELRASDLDEVGEIDEVFREYLDAATAKLDDDQQLVARAVLHCLMTQEFTKQALRLVDFDNAVARLEHDEVATALAVLEAHRLIRKDERGQEIGEVEAWYELTHERLVGTITDWLQRDPRFSGMLAAADLVAGSVRFAMWRESTAALLSAGHLDDVVGPFRGRLRLGPTELEFIVRSAMIRRHPSLAAWAADHDDAVGAGASLAYIRDSLASDDAVVRRGACFGLGALRSSLGEAQPEVIEQLARAGIEDPDADVRSEAGRSLGCLRARLGRRRGGSRRERKAQLSLFADMYAAGHDLGDVSWWRRQRSRWLASRRVAGEHASLIIEARSSALLGAMRGGLTWLVLMIPLFFIWLSFLDVDFAQGAIALSLPIIIVHTLGFIAVWGGVRTAVIQSKIHGSAESWGRLLRRTRLFHWSVFVPSLIWTFVWIIDFSLTDWEPLVGGLAMVGLYWCALPLLAGFARASLSGADSQARGCVWSSLSAMGLSLMIAWGPPALEPVYVMLAYTYVDSFLYSAGGVVLTATGGVAAIVSGAFLRVATSHPEIGLRGSKGDTASRLWRSRSVVVGLLLGSMAIFGPIGWELIPSRVDASTTIAGSLRRLGLAGAPRAYRVQFEFPDSRWHMIEVESASPRGVWSLGDMRSRLYEEFGSPDVVLVNEGTHDLRIEGRGAMKYSMRFRDLGMIPEGVLDLRGTDEEVPALVEWDRERQGFRPSSGFAFPGESVSVYSRPRLVTTDGRDYSKYWQCDIQKAPVHVVPTVDWELVGVLATTTAGIDGSWKLEVPSDFGESHCLDTFNELRDLRLYVIVQHAETHDWVGRPAAGIMLDGRHFDGEDFDFAYATLENAFIRYSSFERARIPAANFTRAQLGKVDFRGAIGAWADFGEARLEAVDFGGANLPFLDMRGARARGAEFVGAQLYGGGFDNATLERADFTGSGLADTSWRSARARGASFRRADLKRAKLEHADIRDADFSGADLSGAKLEVDEGTGASFIAANLSGATVSGIELEALEGACGDGSYRWTSADGRQRDVQLEPCPAVGPVFLPATERPLRRFPRGVCREPPSDDCEKGWPGSDNEFVREGSRLSWSPPWEDGPNSCNCELRPDFVERFPQAADATRRPAEESTAP